MANWQLARRAALPRLRNLAGRALAGRRATKSAPRTWATPFSCRVVSCRVVTVAVATPAPSARASRVVHVVRVGSSHVVQVSLRTHLSGVSCRRRAEIELNELVLIFFCFFLFFALDSAPQ